MEATFGLAGIYDSYIWTISEMSENFKMEYTDWLAIVVGEDVLIRKKYKDAFPCKWKATGMSVGNVPAAWADKRGAYSRRLIYNRFDHVVSTKDGNLEKKCIAELPRLIVKMARAYLSLIRWMEEKGETDIARVWPSMYSLNIAKFQGGNDMLQSFLSSGQIEINPNAYVPKTMFIEAYRKFCTANGQHRQPAWASTVYEAAFLKNKLTFTKDAKNVERVEEKRCGFVNLILFCVLFVASLHCPVRHHLRFLHLHRVSNFAL